MKADRKAVKRNLMNLIDFGYEIEYSETIRMVPNAQTEKLEESYILSDFYLCLEFDDSELRLLTDSLLFPSISPTANARHYRKRPNGSEHEYVFTPYQIATKEEKYYITCNYDKYDDISNYRLDRIRELKILDEPAKPFEALRGTKGQRLNLTEKKYNENTKG